MSRQILSGRADEVISEIHEKIQKFANKAYDSEYVNYRLENKLLAFLCKNHDSSPSECAQSLNLTQEKILRILRDMKIANPEKRNKLLKWADSLADFYAGALTGSKESFDKLEQQRKQDLGYRSLQERLAAIMIYEKFPEIDKFGDKELLFGLGYILAKNYFFHMYDALCHVYDFPLYKRERKKNKEIHQISQEQALKKIDELESELQRTNEMLGELQDEFNDQLQESKISELTDFFAKLNSDRYGNILDQLLQVRTGMDKLKKEGYELPIEINGLFIMVRQLIQFTRDSHIDPIMKPHSKKEVCANDIEFCDYEGSPFESVNDRKIIEVISPGWVYKDQNVQISRPRVKEYIQA